MFDFYNLPVPIWQWILSQVFGLAALVLVVIGFQMKKKQRLLVFVAIANAMSVVMQALLTNYIMAGLAALVVVRLFVYAWLQEKRDKVPLWLDISILVVFLLANVPVVIFTAEWWFDWLFFGFVTFVTFGHWVKNHHVVRLSSIPTTIMILIAAVFYSNIMSVIIESFALISVMVFYARYFRATSHIAK